MAAINYSVSRSEHLRANLTLDVLGEDYRQLVKNDDDLAALIHACVRDRTIHLYQGYRRGDRNCTLVNFDFRTAGLVGELPEVQEAAGQMVNVIAGLTKVTNATSSHQFVVRSIGTASENNEASPISVRFLWPRTGLDDIGEIAVKIMQHSANNLRYTPPSPYTRRTSIGAKIQYPNLVDLSVADGHLRTEDGSSSAVNLEGEAALDASQRLILLTGAVAVAHAGLLARRRDF